MQVNPINNSGSVAGVTNQRDARAARVDAREDASFAQTDKLHSALQALPDIRESEVTRAKALVDQSNYPPMETIRRLANLLAIHLTRSVE